MSARPRAHVLEALSRLRLREAFEPLGWVVEDVAHDYGEDLQVRVFADGEPTPLRFLVEAKATDHIDRYERRGDVDLRIRVSARHLSVWRQLREPVVLALWDARADVMHWETIQDGEWPIGPIKLGQKFATLRLPRDNTLDADGLRRIRARTLRCHQRLRDEQAGMAALSRLLEVELGYEIDYDHEVLLVGRLDGPATLTFWGGLAKMVSEDAERTGETPEAWIEDAFTQALELRELRRRATRAQVFAAAESGDLVAAIDALRRKALRAAELRGL